MRETTQIESRKLESARTVNALQSDLSPRLRGGAPSVLHATLVLLAPILHGIGHIEEPVYPHSGTSLRTLCSTIYSIFVFIPSLCQRRRELVPMALVALAHKLEAVLRYFRDQTILGWILSRLYLIITNQNRPLLQRDLIRGLTTRHTSTEIRQMLFKKPKRNI